MISNAVIPDLPRAGYDKIGAGRSIYDAVVNWSSLKLLSKSPAHYRHKIENPEDGDTDAKLVGRAVHVATLEPHVYDLTFDIWKHGDRRGNDWKDFLGSAILRGREVLKVEQHREVKRIAKAARDCPAAAELLKGKREVTVTWQYTRPDELGLGSYTLDCKARLDLLSDSGAIVDLKTTKDASPEGFGRECDRYGYHLQAAHYRSGFELVTGRRLPYYLLAVENFAPYVAQIYRLEDRELDLGWRQVVELYDRLDYCRRERRWGGYFDGVMGLELPRWSYPDEDEEPIDPTAIFSSTH